MALGTASLAVRAAEWNQSDILGKDLAADIASARALRAGDDPFAEIDVLKNRYLWTPGLDKADPLPAGGNWHPPVSLLLALPLSIPSFPVAGLVWLGVSSAALVSIVWFLGSLLGWSRSVAVAVGAAALAIPIVQKDLAAGQSNALLLLLLVAAWRGLRDGRAAVAGAALGLAISIKPVPTLVLWFLVAARRWRVVGMAAATATAATSLAFVVIGFGRLPAYLEIARESASYWAPAWQNIATLGIVQRWLVPNSWVEGLDAPLLAAVLTGLLVVGAILIIARRPDAGDRFWGVMPVALLLGPITWDHYLVLMVPWMVLSLHRAIQVRQHLLIFVAASCLISVGQPPVGQLWLANLPTIGLALAAAADASYRRTSMLESVP